MKHRKGVENLNLTTFIDLFSTLVCFLLMTAVWNQIEALSTNVEKTTSSDSPSPEKKVSLAVTLLTDRLEMSEDEQAIPVPLVNGEPNTEYMEKMLNYWRQKYPNRKDVILNSDNRVPYKHMIKVFDTLVAQGWSDVGVNTQ